MEEKPQRESRMGTGIAIRLAIEPARGLLLCNIAVGIPLGTAVGVGIGSWWDQQRKTKDGLG